MTDNEMAWNILELVDEFFDGDHNRGIDWLTTKNPMLGNVTPSEMVTSGKIEKLHKFVKSQTELNIPV